MKNFKKSLIGLLISLFFIILVIHQIDIGRTFRAFKEVNLCYILLIIPIYYFSFFIRTLRWQVILSNGQPFKFYSLISTLFIGYTANCLLPARMGDVYRAYLFGKKENISRLKVFMSVVLERIFDGSILVIMFLAVVAKICTKPWVANLSIAAGTIFFGGFAILLIFAKVGKSSILSRFWNLLISKSPELLQKILIKIKNYYKSIIDGLNVFNSPGKLFNSLFLTLIIWLLEAAFMFVVIKSFGITLAPLSIIFSLCVLVFSTMIPAGPASIGPYQYGYILALAVFGISKEVAVAISIVNQFSGVILISLTGFYFICREHIDIKSLDEEVAYE